MDRQDWESKFIEAIISKGMTVSFAKFLFKIIPYYEDKLTPEKAAEIEFNKLYK